MALDSNAPHSIADLVFAGSARTPDGVAIQMPDLSLSHGQFQALITNYARHLRRRGVDRSACIAIDSDHPVIAIGLAVACSLLGCSWVHATQTALRNEVFRITHLLHDGARTERTDANVFRVDASWSNPPAGPHSDDGQPFTGYATADATWMIAQSSGTSGAPKFVPLSEIISCRQATENFSVALPDNAVFGCLFHPLSKPGLLHVIRILAKGGACVFGDLGHWYGRPSLDFVHFDCVLGSPNHFLAFLDRAPEIQARLPLAAVAGSVARKPFFARMLRYFETVNYFYASTEVAIMCSNFITQIESGDDAVSAGAPLPGVEMRIVGEDGAPLPPLREGIVQARTPWQVENYIGAPALSREVFRDGWFHPGDLGYFAADGNLHITGRVNDQLNIGGDKINPDPIDALILATPGVRDGACFALPSAQGIDLLATVIAVTDAGRAEQIAHDLAARVRERLGRHRTPGRIFVLSAPPRNANGKLTRHLFAQAVRGHQPIIVDLG